MNHHKRGKTKIFTMSVYCIIFLLSRGILQSTAKNPPRVCRHKKNPRINTYGEREKNNLFEVFVNEIFYRMLRNRLVGMCNI